MHIKRLRAGGMRGRGEAEQGSGSMQPILSGLNSDLSPGCWWELAAEQGSHCECFPWQRCGDGGALPPPCFPLLQDRLGHGVCAVPTPPDQGEAPLG